MPEIELKYDLDRAMSARIRDSLLTSTRFGAFEARQTGEVKHEDTYFDRHNKLCEQGWSLRVRLVGDAMRIAFKRPVAHATTHGGALEREELENASDADVRATFSSVVALLRGDAVLTDSEEALPNLLVVGFDEAFRRVGLQRLFTIMTIRTRWILVRDGVDVAELALDESHYKITDDDELLAFQMEIEALTDDAAQLVAELDTTARTEFGLRPTSVSKVQRGVEFHGATQVAEKIEAKVDLPSPEDYRALSEEFVRSPTFLSGYRLAGTEGVPRDIEDRYFDTKDYALARANAYLRIREENGRAKLQVRSITPRWESSLPVQEEIKAEDADDGYRRSWPMIVRLLRRILARRMPAVAAEGDIVARLAKLDLRPVLKAAVKRRAWVVEDVEDHGRRTAKIKYDLVVFSTGPKFGDAVEHVEMEVTGLEDEELAPPFIDGPSFHIFVHKLERYCQRRFGNDTEHPVGLHLGSKYVTGLVKTGQADDTLSVRFPPVPGLVRLAPQHSDLPTALESRRSVLRTVVFTFVSAGGLFLLGWLAAPFEVWIRVSAGFLLLVLASWLLLTDRGRLIGAVIRRVLVVAVALLAAAILVAGLGLDFSADVLSLLGWPLTVIGLLSLNLIRRSASDGDG